MPHTKRPLPLENEMRKLGDHSTATGHVSFLILQTRPISFDLTEITLILMLWYVLKIRPFTSSYVNAALTTAMPGSGNSFTMSINVLCSIIELPLMYMSRRNPG